MPARNSNRTLRLAVRSTLKALDADDELLVGLHKSSDASMDILKTIKDHRLRVYEITSGSFSEALNFLIEQSSPNCGYVARMDADDICLPWRFKIQKRFASKMPNTFLFSSVLVLMRLGWFAAVVPQYPFRLQDAEIRELLIDGNPLNHPTMFVGKDSLVSLGGYRSLAGEDLDLWLRATLEGHALFRSAIPLVVYRLSPSQLSRSLDYIEGWSSGSEIRRSRERLRDQIKSTRPGSRVSQLKVALQKLGLPTPRKLLRLFTLR